MSLDPKAWGFARFFSRRKDQETPPELRPEKFKECRVIAVGNERGGVFKTGWTILLARQIVDDYRLQDLYGRKPRVAMVGLDPAAALEGYCGFQDEKLNSIRGVALHQAMHHPDVDGKEPLPLEVVRQQISRDIDLYPAHPDLAGYDARMQHFRQLVVDAQLEGNEEAAAKCMEKLRAYQQLLVTFIGILRTQYDRVLIDFKPGESQLNVAGLLAANDVHIPTVMEQESITQARRMAELVHEVRGRNPNLQITAVIPTNYDKRDRQQEYWYDTIRKPPKSTNVVDLSSLVTEPIAADRDMKKIIERAGSPAYRRTIYKVAGKTFEEIMQREGAW